MKIVFNDLNAQYASIRIEIDTAIAAVIAESAFVRSRFVDEFELAWAAASKTKRCVSCGNGTDALFIAMKGLGVSPGDEIITTAHSWIATSETITQAGGRVVFCDTEPVTYTIDTRQIEAKVSPRTVGIIPVHLYGQPADMTSIQRLADKHGLWVIEDCAQAHLATHAGRLVGSFGNVATYSFYPGKNLGAFGDAGSINSNDDRLADWCATYARHGGKGDHVMEGINSRLDGLQAAILNAKLSHLQRWTARRQELAARYDMALRGVGDLTLPSIASENTHVFHLYVIRTARRDALRDHLAKAQIATVINYPRALPFYPAYAYLKHIPEDFPTAFRHQSEILSLPIYPEMTFAMIEQVAEEVRRFFDGR